jgi:hypothetical protein
VIVNVLAEVAAKVKLFADPLDTSAKLSIEATVRVPPVTFETVTVAASLVRLTTSAALCVNVPPLVPLLLSCKVVPKSMFVTANVSLDPLLCTLVTPVELDKSNVGVAAPDALTVKFSTFVIVGVTVAFIKATMVSDPAPPSIVSKLCSVMFPADNPAFMLSSPEVDDATSIPVVSDDTVVAAAAAGAAAAAAVAAFAAAN